MLWIIAARKRLRLDKNATIAGQPIKRVRELLRRMGSAHWSDREIADFFHIDDVKAHALIDEMAVRGFLQESEQRPGNSSRFYECGPQGSRLASARLLKAITRQKADVIIATLLQRVEMVNARPELLERVCEVRVFGSYLEERDDFGDIDVAVRTERKEGSGKNWVRESLQRAEMSGRTFSSYLDRLFYGHTEVMRLLKARSRYLSLHTMDDLEAIGALSRILFKHGSGPR
jgi:predicted nucleotidyltransferase